MYTVHRHIHCTELVVADIRHSAVDPVRAGQTPRSAGGAAGRGGSRQGVHPGRYPGDAEEGASDQRSPEGITEVSKPSRQVHCSEGHYYEIYYMIAW